MKMQKIKGRWSKAEKRHWRICGRLDLLRALQVIEECAGDDFCEELSMSRASGGRYRLRGRIKVAAEKLGRIYRIAHSWNPQHSCFEVHDAWRKETKPPERAKP